MPTPEPEDEGTTPPGEPWDHDGVRWLGDAAPPGLEVPRAGYGTDLPDGDTLVLYTRSTFGDAATRDEQSVIDALPVVRRGLPPSVEVVPLALGLEDELLADFAVVDAGGRWRPGTHDPDSFVAGDVLALRYYSLFPSLRRVNSIIQALGTGRWKPGDQDGIDLFWHCRMILSSAAKVQHAASYYLPVHSAQAILASTPPDAELRANIRLPFPAVTVYFGADLEIPPAFQRWSEHLDTSRAETTRLLEQVTDPVFTDPYQPATVIPPGTPHRARRDLTMALRDLGGYLSGVTLLAEEDGSLADQVLWTVATNLDPAFADTAMRYDRMRGIIDGYLPASTLAPLAWNLAAAVCWGAWSPPPEPPQLPPADAGKVWRKAWKHSAVKKAERRGALAGVRVINLARMTAPSRRATPDPTRPARKSPIPHPRRGHWNRYRLGPRADWHYEGRWIPGRMVSLTGGTPEQPGRVVYRLPVPEGAPGAEALDKET